MSIPVKPIPYPDVSGLVTEDDTPVDNIYSEKQRVLFRDPLYNTWTHTNGGRHFAAMTNVGLFYAVTQPPIVPDGLLSLAVDLPDDLMRKEHRSYFMWEYGNAPELTFEVVSNNEGDELDGKVKLYARIGILYYVVWDPENILDPERLHLFELHGRKYRRLKKAWFPEIGLGMTVWHGKYENGTAEWLRWCDEHGNVLATGDERANQAEARADEAQKRADKLAAHLRALGIDPDAP